MIVVVPASSANRVDVLTLRGQCNGTGSSEYLHTRSCQVIAGSCDKEHDIDLFGHCSRV